MFSRKKPAPTHQPRLGQVIWLIETVVMCATGTYLVWSMYISCTFYDYASVSIYGSMVCISPIPSNYLNYHQLSTFNILKISHLPVINTIAKLTRLDLCLPTVPGLSVESWRGRPPRTRPAPISGWGSYTSPKHGLEKARKDGYGLSIAVQTRAN